MRVGHQQAFTGGRYRQALTQRGNRIRQLEARAALTEGQLQLAEAQVKELEEQFSMCALHEDQIDLTTKLGAGSFGDVWKGTYSRYCFLCRPRQVRRPRKCVCVRVRFADDRCAKPCFRC